MFALAFIAHLSAQAAETACDAKALTKELTDAAPTAVAGLYTQLVACDPTVANKLAPTIIPKLLADADGHKAALAAIEAGSGEAVRTWVGSLQSDEKARTIGAIGDACQASKAVQTFFVDAHKQLADVFWTDRWYRGLEACRVPAVQDILKAQLDKGVGSDRSRFVGVLETYSRNLGGASLPKLEELGKTQTDPEILSYVVAAFADAANVGSGSADPKIAEQAAKIIVALAPSWPDKAVEQARITLTALGDERAADALVGIRYKASVQKDGSLLYGAVVTEKATCKNKKTQEVVHVASVSDPAQTWPDQLEGKVLEATKHGWELDLATRCKGEGTVEVRVPEAPLADTAAYQAWMKAQVADIEKTEVDKRTRMDHEPVGL